ncbi:MAG: methylenetetrahydrofolate reductase [Candidatus Thorarchaeota archaeon]
MLDNGEFVVTCEIGAPRGADSTLLIERIEMVADFCDAINIPDNARGVPTMSSTVCAKFVLQAGVEPILHITTRDRNQIAIQSELYGAYALGVRNILFMTGDHVRFGSHPTAKMVYDLDTLQSLHLAKRLSNGIDFIGDELEGVPEFYLGATINPNVDPLDDQVKRTQKKIEAGAQFFQTQAIFDPKRLDSFLKQVDSDLYILAGIIPLRDSEMANFLNEFVPGIHVPSDLIKRLEEVGHGLDEDARIDAMKAEGIQIALELIDDVSNIDGVHGLHLMGVGWTESIVDLVKRAELYPRPKKVW